MSSTDENIKTKAIEIYDQALRKYGDHSLAVLCSPAAQIRRFIHLVENIDIREPGISILDVGCGNGEFFNFLETCGFSGKYTGYDINRGLLDLARSKYPSDRVDFEQFDILNDGPNRSFDYVFMSGLFNSDYGQNFDWICRFVSAMFSLSRRATVFNAISTHVNRREETMYYVDPCALLDYIVRNVTPSATIIHDAPVFNFQVELRPARRPG